MSNQADGRCRHGSGGRFTGLRVNALPGAWALGRLVLGIAAIRHFRFFLAAWVLFMCCFMRRGGVCSVSGISRVAISRSGALLSAGCSGQVGVTHLAAASVRAKILRLALGVLPGGQAEVHEDDLKIFRWHFYRQTLSFGAFCT